MSLAAAAGFPVGGWITPKGSAAAATSEPSACIE
jgi:hypothetical protein